MNAISGGVAPDLLMLDKECVAMDAGRKADCLQEADEYFKGVVLHGKQRDGRVVMPAYDPVFTQEAVWAIKACIDARTITVNGTN